MYTTPVFFVRLFCGKFHIQNPACKSIICYLTLFQLYCRLRNKIFVPVSGKSRVNFNVHSMRSLMEDHISDSSKLSEICRNISWKLFLNFLSFILYLFFKYISGKIHNAFMQTITKQLLSKYYSENLEIFCFWG